MSQNEHLPQMKVGFRLGFAWEPDALKKIQTYSTKWCFDGDLLCTIHLKNIHEDKQASQTQT